MASLGRTSRGLAALALLIALTASPAVCAAQSERPAPAHASASRSYPNSPDGLRQFLASLLLAAKTTDPGRVDALLVQTEIPDSENWFAHTFGPDDGARQDDLYRRTLDENENSFERGVQDLARQGGEFQVRKVNDAPRAAESAMLRSFRQHVDLYFVSWKPKGPAAADPLVHPYFVFVAGSFRWETLLVPPDETQPPDSSGQISESNIPRRNSNASSRTPATTSQRSASLPGAPPLPPSAPLPAASTPGSGANPNPPVYQPLYVPSSPAPSSPSAATVYTPGQNGVGFPTCVSCPSPTYPDSARADRLEGTVVLRATIGVDGHASDITLVRTDALIFVEPAIAAVRGWRFKPAPGPEGKPVPVVAPVEVTFRFPQSK